MRDLIYTIKKSFLKKKTTMIICKKKMEKILRKKIKKNILIKLYKNFYNGFITNNKKNLFKNVDNIISIGKNSDHIFNEIKKKNIKGILLSKKNTIKNNPDYFLSFDSENVKNVLILIKQLLQIEKKFSYKYPFYNKKNVYYFCGKENDKKIAILSLSIKQDLFIKKKFFILTIKKIINFLLCGKKGSMYFIISRIKKLIQFYNEKIKVLGVKIIKTNKNYINFYLHNNKKLSFCIYREKKYKEEIVKIIMNMIALEHRINKNFLKDKYIFDESKTIKDIIKKNKIKKIYFVK